MREHIELRENNLLAAAIIEIRHRARLVANLALNDRPQTAADHYRVPGASLRQHRATSNVAGFVSRLAKRRRPGVGNTTFIAHHFPAKPSVIPQRLRHLHQCIRQEIPMTIPSAHHRVPTTAQHHRIPLATVYGALVFEYDNEATIDEAIREARGPGEQLGARSMQSAIKEMSERHLLRGAGAYSHPGDAVRQRTQRMFMQSES